jgi:hypothetical protein
MHPDVTLLDKKGILVPNCVVQVRKERAVLVIANPLSENVLLQANTSIGHPSSEGVSCATALPETVAHASRKDGKPIEFDVNPGLTRGNRNSVQAILETYRDVFTGPDDKLGRTSITEHRIELAPGTKPVKQSPTAMAL